MSQTKDTRIRGVHLQVLGVLFAAPSGEYIPTEKITRVLEESPEYVRDAILDLIVDELLEWRADSTKLVRITSKGRTHYVLTPKPIKVAEFFPSFA